MRHALRVDGVAEVPTGLVGGLRCDLSKALLAEDLPGSESGGVRKDVQAGPEGKVRALPSDPGAPQGQVWGAAVLGGLCPVPSEGVLPAGLQPGRNEPVAGGRTRKPRSRVS